MIAGERPQQATMPLPLSSSRLLFIRRVRALTSHPAWRTLPLAHDELAGASDVQG
jgi:hypothetical protein